ncbi:hypothetical protein IWX92DRAFT_370626 [Phyllosticta citricarpa]
MALLLLVCATGGLFVSFDPLFFFFLLSYSHLTLLLLLVLSPLSSFTIANLALLLVARRLSVPIWEPVSRISSARSTHRSVQQQKGKSLHACFYILCHISTSSV